MLPDTKSLYLSIHEYVYYLVKDKDISVRLITVFIRAEVPLQTFITAAKLYEMILNRANLEAERKFSRDNLCSDKSRLIGKMSTKLVRCPYQTFISCCVIASKFYKDIAFNNESWGGIAFLSKNEINEFERLTLATIDYKVNNAGDGHVKTKIEELLKRSGYEISEMDPKAYDFKYIMKKLFCLT